MTTAKQKSVRDFRGRFKKRRHASPSEARQIFDRMYEKAERAREAAEEAHLRTPEGERERQERNAAMVARMRAEKNPRDKGAALKRGDRALWDTFSGLIPVRILEIDGPSGSPTSSQRIHFEIMKAVGPYKKGSKNQSSGLRIVAREFVKRAKYGTRILPGTRFLGDHRETQTNPVGKFVIVGYSKGPNNDWFYNHSSGIFENEARGLERATRYKSRSHAERIAESLRHKLPARITHLEVETAK